MHGGTLRDHGLRAAEAEYLAAGRLTVRPFGAAGFAVATPTGRRWVVSTVDELAGVLDATGSKELGQRARLHDRGPALTPVSTAVVRRLGNLAEHSPST